MYKPSILICFGKEGQAFIDSFNIHVNSYVRSVEISKLFYLILVINEQSEDKYSKYNIINFELNEDNIISELYKEKDGLVARLLSRVEDSYIEILNTVSLIKNDYPEQISEQLRIFLLGSTTHNCGAALLRFIAHEISNNLSSKGLIATYELVLFLPTIQINNQAYARTYATLWELDTELKQQLLPPSPFTNCYLLGLTDEDSILISEHRTHFDSIAKAIVCLLTLVDELNYNSNPFVTPLKNGSYFRYSSLGITQFNWGKENILTIIKNKLIENYSQSEVPLVSNYQSNDKDKFIFKEVINLCLNYKDKNNNIIEDDNLNNLINSLDNESIKDEVVEELILNIIKDKLLMLSNDKTIGVNGVDTLIINLLAEGYIDQAKKEKEEEKRKLLETIQTLYAQIRADEASEINYTNRTTTDDSQESTLWRRIIIWIKKIFRTESSYSNNSEASIDKLAQFLNEVQNFKTVKYSLKIADKLPSVLLNIHLKASKLVQSLNNQEQVETKSNFTKSPYHHSIFSEISDFSNFFDISKIVNFAEHRSIDLSSVLFDFDFSINNQIEALVTEYANDISLIKLEDIFYNYLLKRNDTRPYSLFYTKFLSKTKIFIDVSNVPYAKYLVIGNSDNIFFLKEIAKSFPNSLEDTSFYIDNTVQYANAISIIKLSNNLSINDLKGKANFIREYKRIEEKKRKKYHAPDFSNLSDLSKSNMLFSQPSYNHQKERLVLVRAIFADIVVREEYSVYQYTNADTGEKIALSNNKETAILKIRNEIQHFNYLETACLKWESNNGSTIKEKLRDFLNNEELIHLFSIERQELILLEEYFA